MKAGTQNIKSALVATAKSKIASGVGDVAGDLGLKTAKTKPVPAYSIVRYRAISRRDKSPYSQACQHHSHSVEHGQPVTSQALCSHVSLTKICSSTQSVRWKCYDHWAYLTKENGHLDEVIVRPIYRLWESSGAWCSKQFRRHEICRGRCALPEECIMHPTESIVGRTGDRGSKVYEAGFT